MSIPGRSSVSSRTAVFNWPALVAGVVFALVLLKLGIPVILDFRTETPATFGQVIEQTWPMKWGYRLIAVFLILGAGWNWLQKNAGTQGRGLVAVNPLWQRVSWMLWLPAMWLAWQFISATHTVDAKLTRVVLPHFTFAVACFYFGYFTLGRIPSLMPFWLSLTVGLALVLMLGVYQRFVTMEQTRVWVLEHEAKHWTDVSPEELQDLVRSEVVVRQADGTFAAEPEVIKRVLGGRIYATFIYANALAAAILLLFPLACVTIWKVTEAFNEQQRLVPLALMLYLGFACLYWSGSKTGWLVCLGMLTVILFHLPFSRNAKLGLVIGLLVLGSAGFALKYRSYFAKGGTSVLARFDAWRAATEIAKANPLLGSGPGTFGNLYEKMKKPDAEMARLAHNDFLEQASDTGFFGFLTYSGLLFGSIILLYRYSSKNILTFEFAVWLGLLGWVVHSFAEFSLYIPATAWIAFLLFGWLWGARKAFDKAPGSG